jgi:hypothetical protein
MGVRVSAIAAAVLAGLVAIGCGGVTDPSKNQSETFTGALTPGGRWNQTVNVSNGGEFSVKLTALSPTPTAVLGMVWAQGANCELTLQSVYASLNQQALAGAIFQKGAYCVLVYDPGTLSVAQNFTIIVSHP